MKTVVTPLVWALSLGTPALGLAQERSVDDAATQLNDEEPTAAESTEPTSGDSTSEREHTNEAMARAAFREGDRLYYEGDYEGAVENFEQAYALSGRIEMLFNLANAHERLRNYTQASVALRGYIPHAPDPSRPALERRLTRLLALAEEQRQQREKQRETAPPPRVEVREAPQTKMIPLDRALGYGLTTLGVAGLATGVGFAISATAARDQLDTLCTDGIDGRVCPEEAESYVKRDKMHSLAADISFVAGAAMSATGVYLMIRKTDEGELNAGAGPGSVYLWGSF